MNTAATQVATHQLISDLTEIVAAVDTANPDLPEAFLTVVYNIHDQHGDCVRVGPDGDGLDIVRVQYIDAKIKGSKQSETERTRADFTMTPDMAIKTALALLKAAQDAMAAAATYGTKG